MQVCGYVAQEIVLPGTSTVTEYLSFHAALRLPAALVRASAGSSSSSKHMFGFGAGGGGGGGSADAGVAAAALTPVQARVAAVVAELGLTRVAKSLIGDDFVRGLSGDCGACVGVVGGRG